MGIWYNLLLIALLYLSIQTKSQKLIITWLRLNRRKLSYKYETTDLRFP
jgi:hypothetical protein